MKQDQLHASELENAKQKRTFVSNIRSGHPSKENLYEESFDSISDIPEPRVFTRSTSSRHQQQTESESGSIEELIESAVNLHKNHVPHPAQNNSFGSSGSIEELIQSATSYIAPKHLAQRKESSLKDEVTKRKHPIDKSELLQPSPAEIQLNTVCIF
jgi:hypothetical protein